MIFTRRALWEGISATGLVRRCSIAREILCWKENVMTDIELARLALRVRELTAACSVNDVARTAYDRSTEAYVQSGCEHTAHDLETTGRAWDMTRDEVVKKAQALLNTLTIVLGALPDGEMPFLRAQTKALHDAFRAEETAHLLYRSASGGSKEARQRWQACRTAIVAQAYSLIPHMAGITPTEVGA